MDAGIYKSLQSIAKGLDAVAKELKLIRKNSRGVTEQIDAECYECDYWRRHNGLPEMDCEDCYDCTPDPRDRKCNRRD